MMSRIRVSANAPVIKVCGVQRVEEAAAALAAGANTIGLLVGMTHVAEDAVTAETARAIVLGLPKGVRTVMVTHLLDAGDIAALATGIGASAIQVHGDLPVEGVLELGALVPGLELLKAVHVTGPDAVSVATRYAPHVDMLVLDSRTTERLGGTGQTHDWRISRRIVDAVDIPVILAGGLNPSNVAAAIRAVRPAGIDANSGLEDAHHTKDPAKVAVFARAGRRCAWPAGVR